MPSPTERMADWLRMRDTEEGNGIADSDMYLDSADELLALIGNQRTGEPKGDGKLEALKRISEMSDVPEEYCGDPEILKVFQGINAEAESALSAPSEGEPIEWLLDALERVAEADYPKHEATDRRIRFKKRFGSFTRPPFQGEPEQ